MLTASTRPIRVSSPRPARLGQDRVRRDAGTGQSGPRCCKSARWSWPASTRCRCACFRPSRRGTRHMKRQPGTLITLRKTKTWKHPLVSGIAFNRDEAKITMPACPTSRVLRIHHSGARGRRQYRSRRDHPEPQQSDGQDHFTLHRASQRLSNDDRPALQSKVMPVLGRDRNRRRHEDPARSSIVGIRHVQPRGRGEQDAFRVLS